MKCDTARNLFSDYLERTIEPPLALTLDLHFSECSECAREYAEFKSVWGALDALPEKEPPLTFRRQVMARVVRERASVPRQRSFWSLDLGNIFGARVPARALAAVFAVLILIALAVQIGPQITGIAMGGHGIQREWPKTSNDLGRGDTGLSLSIKPKPGDLNGTYQIIIEPKSNGVGNLRLYLLPKGTSTFTHSALSRGTMTEIPASTGQPIVAECRPGTAYLRWDFRNGRFSEAIFMPTRLARTRPESSIFEALGTTLYNALATAAEVYGVVIAADADLGSGLIDVDAGDRTIGQALDEILADVPGSAIHWHRIRSNVYAITRE